MRIRTRGTSSIFVAVAVIVVLATLLTAIGLLPSQPGGGTTTTTTTGVRTSASVNSVDGLTLTLQVSSTQIGSGGSVRINVTEANGSNRPLNESAGSRWALQGLRMGPCYSSVYPFGVAVYKGHYASSDISSEVRLNLYPLVPCPLLLRYVSGYYFQASSDMAVVLPGTSSELMSSGLTASGNYTTGTNLTPFAPGQYTVVAGDEWGALVFLYFEVY